MLVVIGADIFTRYLLNFSFEIADELGGYMLVVMTFVSLSVCQVNGAFHQVELVQARLTPRGRALSAAIFDVLSFGFAALLLWHFVRLELSSYRFGERAPTYLKRRCGFRDSRWRSASRRCCSRSSAPSSPMCDASAGSRMGPELQILIVTVLFLACSQPGWRYRSRSQCRPSSIS